MDVRRNSSSNLPIYQNQTLADDSLEKSALNESTSANRQALGNVISKAKTPKSPFKKIPTRLKPQSEKKYRLGGKIPALSGAPQSRLRSPLGYELSDERPLQTRPEAIEDNSELPSATGFTGHTVVSNLPPSKLDSHRKVNSSNKYGLTRIVDRRAKLASDSLANSPIQLAPLHDSTVGSDQQLTSEPEKSTEQSKSSENPRSASNSRSSSGTNAPRPEFRKALPKKKDSEESDRTYLLSHLNRDLLNVREQKLDNEVAELQGELDDLTAIVNSYMAEGHIPSSLSNTTEPQFSERSLKDSDSSDEGRRIAALKDKRRLAYKAKGSGLNDAGKIAATAYTAKEKLAKFNQYLPLLPVGVTLNPNGTFYGTYTTHSFPERIIHTDWDKNIAVKFSKRGNELINHKKLAPKPVGGVTLVNAAEADFRRAKFQIPHRDGSPNIDGRFTDSQVVAKALKDFTGNDTVSLVLSSLMNQEVSGALFFAMPNQSGEDLYPNLRVMTAAKGREINKELNSQLKAEGLFAKFTLSRFGEDYKITVTLDALLDQEGKPLLPIRRDQPMKVHFETEIIVNAEKAREGVLELSMPGGVRCESKGRLDPSLVK